MTPFVRSSCVVNDHLAFRTAAIGSLVLAARPLRRGPILRTCSLARPHRAPPADLARLLRFRSAHSLATARELILALLAAVFENACDLADCLLSIVFLRVPSRSHRLLLINRRRPRPPMMTPQMRSIGALAFP